VDHEDAGRFWEGNAEAWPRLARAGYDVCRDGFNTPEFFAMLPGIEGLACLGIGCGEGHNTRLLAGRGARMTGIYSSPHLRPLRERLKRLTPQASATRSRAPLIFPRMRASTSPRPL
jgi:hypothetical protein